MVMVVLQEEEEQGIDDVLTHSFSLFLFHFLDALSSLLLLHDICNTFVMQHSLVLVYKYNFKTRIFTKSTLISCTYSFVSIFALMVAPVAGPSTQQQPRPTNQAPPATANLLRSLAPVHSTYFPRSRPPKRPDTDIADTPELKEDARNKVALLKSVLGTYFSDVEMDLFNSSKGEALLRSVCASKG